MKNKLILLLGMAVILLSFFAFRGGETLTGFAVKDRVHVDSRFIEEPSYVIRDDNTITTLYTDKPLVKRGDEFTLIIDLGENGVRTRGEIRDINDNFVQYFYICGLSFINDKICTSSRHLPLSVSRTASSPKKNPYVITVYDGAGQKVSMPFSVK